MKNFLTTVALAALVASPAFAASRDHAVHKQTASNVGYSSFAGPLSEEIVSGDKIVGRDPDVNVRLQLLRDADSYEY